MSAKEYDCIIVGAGPAGCSAACVLGQAGKRVLLLDRNHFPRDKTCGDGLTYKCLQPLKKIGLEEKFRRNVRFFTRGYSMFFSDGNELTVRKNHDSDYIVFVLPRFDFDNLLLQHALEAGVDFLPDNRAVKLLMRNGRTEGVVVQNGAAEKTLSAPLIIDASGANSRLAVQAGAGNRNPRECALAIRGYYENVQGLSDVVEFYFDKSILPGYYWIFPTSGSTANIGCGTFQHIIREQQLDLRQMMADFFQHHPVAGNKLKNARLVGKLSGGKIPLAINHQNSRARNGLIMIGDAASFTDPITAEGISYALTSGILAGEVAVEALESNQYNAEFLSRYDDRWKEKFSDQFTRASMLSELSPPDLFKSYLIKSFEENVHAGEALKDVATQFEFMFKLKSLMKAL